MPGLTPGVTIVGRSAVQKSATSPLTTAWTPSTGTFPLVAGQHLLVAGVAAVATTSLTAIACSTAGWTQVGTGILSSTRAAASWWWKKAAGSDAVPVFTSTLSGTSGIHAVLWELAGTRNVAQPWDTSGTASGTTANPLTVTTGAAVATAGEMALSCHAIFTGSSAADAWTPSAGWTNDGTDAATATFHTAFDHLASPPAGSTLACGGTWAVAGTFEVAMSVVILAALAEGWGVPL